MRPADLARGDGGEAVRDLKRRIGKLGYDVSGDEPGRFGDATEGAVRAFQEARGLAVDGICGRHTWAALVESGFSLGDRMLYARRPMLRGDDVVELQRRLNRLGFDAGREDGILGDSTIAALTEFQRNAGLAADGMCGSTTVSALDRVSSLAAGSVASFREREEIRRGSRRLGGKRVYVVAMLGFEAIGDAVTRGLLTAGANAVLDISGADESLAAAAANRFEADLCLALGSGAADECRCCYFASPTFRSEGGYRVATSVQEELSRHLAAGAACRRSHGLLRETRMAAVVCELVERGDIDAMRDLVPRAGDVGRAIVEGVRRGIEENPANQR